MVSTPYYLDNGSVVVTATHLQSQTQTMREPRQTLVDFSPKSWFAYSSLLFFGSLDCHNKDVKANIICRFTENQAIPLYRDKVCSYLLILFCC